MPVNLAQVGDAARSRRLHLADAAGWPAIVTVLCAGLTAGFFAWYVYLTRGPHGPLMLEASSVARHRRRTVARASSLGRLRALLRQRTDIPYAAALRWDVASWAALLLLWLILVSPARLRRRGGRSPSRWAPSASIKLLVAARFNATVRDVLVTFVVTRVPIVIIAELAAVIVGQRAGVHFAASGIRCSPFGGAGMPNITSASRPTATRARSPAFFPLYPLLIRIVGGLTGNHLIAGLLISNVASFFGAAFLYKLVEHEFNRHVAHRAIFYVSIFPTAIFFSAVYTESLFFFLVGGVVLLHPRTALALAGVFGFFAALTRVEGVLLAVPFLDRVGRRALRVAPRLVQMAARHGRQAARRPGADPAGPRRRTWRTFGCCAAIRSTSPTFKPIGAGIWPRRG